MSSVLRCSATGHTLRSDIYTQPIPSISEVRNAKVGWSSSDHLYAVRSDPLQRERADDGRNHALRAQGDPAAHRFPDPGRDDRPDDSGYLRRDHEAFGTK